MYALEGIRVLDLSQFLAGPATSMYLGDQGAEVIKIEPPGTGDAMRQSPEPFYEGNSLGYIFLNRNKKSVTVDIRTPAGREIIERLAETSDVLIHNLRPAVARRLGLGYEELSGKNPRLVYASVSAYGLAGPYADRGGYDRILQGLAGLMTRRLPDGMPITTGVYAADAATGMIMAFGIMVALWFRERTGKGQNVEGSLLHTWLALQSGQLAFAAKGPAVESEAPARTPGVFRCGDGAYINIAANNDRQLASLARLIGLGGLIDDPSYKNPAVRAQTRKQVYATLEEQLLTGTAAEWLERIQGADVPAGPILERRAVFQEPQIVENGMLTTVEHPVLGPVTHTTPPVHLSKAESGQRGIAPSLGQHTNEVLCALGYSQEQVRQLRADGII